MCRALRVLCVAPDAEALRRLKAASVGAEWELSPGAVSAEGALEQLAGARAHVMVVAGSFGDLARKAKAAYPGLRIVADTPGEGVDVLVEDLSEIRLAIAGRKPAGPVRSPDPHRRT